MSIRSFPRSLRLAALTAIVFVAPGRCAAQISTEKFTQDAIDFLTREIAAHMAEVKSLDPPQATVFGARTTGDFNWGTYMRAVAEWSALTGRTAMGGKDIAAYLGKVGLIEAKGGGKTFAQWYSALALEQFGSDLRTNRLWQSLTPAEQALWRSLLDTDRFYDRKTRHVIDLPENYFGVAARIAAVDYQLGLSTDRSFADDVLTRAAGQFLNGALYTDDDLPHGRYDRYSQEYARTVYDVALMLDRKDIVAAVEPALRQDFKTWWAVVSPDGYSFPWGRTIGPISYFDTLDIVGFLARYPQFRPAPLPQLAGVYHAALQHLESELKPDSHLLPIWAFGHGNYHYMLNREWQNTTQFLGKAAASLNLLRAALAKENVASFPADPSLPDVNRFDWFRQGDRPAGVWLVRHKNLAFALPFTTGVVSSSADYLPAPHGMPGFAAPVEQNLPALVPFLELSYGRTVVASDGADQIEPAADGLGVRAVWKRWGVVGAPPQQFLDIGLQTEVTWKLDNDTLVRTEKFTATLPVSIRRFSVIYPSTADRVSTTIEAGHRTDHFYLPHYQVDIAAFGSDLPLSASIEATGDLPIGKGARGYIPLVLRFDAVNLSFEPGQSRTWTLRYRLTTR